MDESICRGKNTKGRSIELGIHKIIAEKNTHSVEYLPSDHTITRSLGWENGENSQKK